MSSTVYKSFPMLETHDPNGTRLRTLKLILDAGDSLTSDTTIKAVDASGNEIAGGDFTVEVIAMALLTASATGDEWGVNFKLHGGLLRLNEEPFPLIRLRPYFASQPSEPAYDQTYRVPIRHT